MVNKALKAGPNRREPLYSWAGLPGGVGDRYALNHTAGDRFHQPELNPVAKRITGLSMTLFHDLHLAQADPMFTAVSCHARDMTITSPQRRATGPHSNPALPSLGQLGIEEITAPRGRQSAAQRLGATFPGSTGSAGCGEAQSFPLIPCPALSAPATGRRLEEGLIQRPKRIESLLAMFYGDQPSSDGVVPAAMREAFPCWRPQMRGFKRRSGVWCSVRSSDLGP